jgi:hypothetical protein
LILVRTKSFEPIAFRHNKRKDLGFALAAEILPIMALPNKLASSTIPTIPTIHRAWMAEYNKLKEFKERNGSLRRLSRKNPRLHRWMSDQRFLGNLDDPRVFHIKKQLLDHLQFDRSNADAINDGKNDNLK